MHRPLHPLHAVLLAGCVPLFLGVLLNDLAYASTYEIQWKNFASWLLVGGLFLAGLTLLWAVIGFFQTKVRTPYTMLYPLLLLAAWILGFIDALVHARDAWASMPTGLVLSAIVVVLVSVATAIGFHRSHARASA